MKKSTKKRNEEVLRLFKRLSNEKRDGVSVYNYAYIISVVAQRFFIAEKTVENILKRGE